MQDLFQAPIRWHTASALSSMLFFPCQIGFIHSSSPLTPYNIHMTLSDGASEAGDPGGAFRSARSCYAIFAAFHVSCCELWGMCGITSRCMTCGGVIRTQVFCDLSNKSLLFYPQAPFFFLSRSACGTFEPNAGKFRKTKIYIEKRRRRIAGKCQDKVTYSRGYVDK